MNNAFLLPVLFSLLISASPNTSWETNSIHFRSHNIDNSTYTAYHDNGIKKFFVVYRRNKMTGDWKSWYPSGIICDSGRFSGNVPDSKWVGWYPNGSIRYSWTLSASKLSALKDELLRQPKIKHFFISQKHVTEAVKYYQSDYLFKQPVTKSRVNLRANLVHLKTYDLHSIEEKVNRNTVESGSDYIPPFPEMLLHGEYTSYYQNGKIKEEGVYINGLREGVWEEHTTVLDKSRGSYLRGYRSGEWRTYDQRGKLLYFTLYKNGEVIETYEFSSGKRP